MACSRIFRLKHMQHLLDACRPIARANHRCQSTYQFVQTQQMRTVSSAMIGHKHICLVTEEELFSFPNCSRYTPLLINSRTLSTNIQLYSKETNSNQTDKPTEGSESSGDSESSDKSLTVFQRFKKTYKEHGKVLIGVHLATSAVWFGSFFYAASVGVDIIPVMEYMGFSEKIISPFRNSNLGNVALAYLMYKLATPARYTVTLAGTNFMVKYLRKTGKMEPKQASESLRSLAKDSRVEIKERTVKLRSEMSKRRMKVRKIVNSKVKERQSMFKDRTKIFESQFQERKKTFEQKFKSRQRLLTAKLKARLKNKTNRRR